MDRETELALVERLRRGDALAFDSVYEAYHGRLFNFLSRLSRRRDVAEDLLEETWLRLVASAGRLQSDTRLGPWLFTVARNIHVSYCRSRLLDESHLPGLIGLWPTAPAHVPSPFEEAAASELGRRLDRALLAIPARHREVLLLVGVEGFTPAEAASICGVTPEAFRQRLSRARSILARELTANVKDVLPVLTEVMT
jgi:RNA polymerase sigma-70 factor (ECF subfamily)